MIKLNIEYIQAINFSLINNRMAVCQSLEVTNDSSDDAREVVIECSGEFFQETRTNVIDVIKAGKTLRLQGIELNPIVSKVASVTEKVISSFTIRVVSNSQSENKNILLTKDYDIDIMPFDQWLGTSILPQCLASFVLPNNPSIANVVVKAAAKLKEITGASAFT